MRIEKTSITWNNETHRIKRNDEVYSVFGHLEYTELVVQPAL